MPTAKPGNSASPHSSPPTNVVLITVDTLRSDRLGAAGNPKRLTPHIDSLASDGIMFSRAIAQVPLTLPSHTTILTGTYPMWHGVQDLSTPGVPRNVRTLAETFQSHGYKTAAFVSAFILHSSSGLSRGFDYYDDWFVTKKSAGNVGGLERRAEETVDRALQWLRLQRTGPFFLWVHLYDPHAPYDAPEPFKSKFRTQPYDGEVAYVDSQLGRLFDFLKDRKLYTTSTIVLTSDHGEALGEHQEQQHGLFVYNSTVHVPLILKPAGRRTSIRRTDAVANLVDLAPTLAKACGFSIRPPHTYQGRDLLALDANEGALQHMGYAESLYPRSSFGWHSLHSVQNDRYHYIEAGKPELYDLAEDAGETKNIVEEKPAVASVMKEKLASILFRYQSHGKAAASQPLLTIERSRQLQSLGYVGSSPVPIATLDSAEAADPKDKIGLYNDILQATELTGDREFEQSDRLLQSLSVKNPTLFLLPYLRGENLFAAGSAREAIPFYQRALELNPSFDLAAMGLGHAAYQSGNNGAAVKAYQLVLAINPHNFLVRLALAKAYVRLNRLPEAATEQREVLQLTPHVSQAYADYAETLVLMKQFKEALPVLRKATKNGHANSDTLNLLGNVSARMGLFEDAIKAYRRAIDADPEYAPAYLSLALIYYKLQDQRHFREYYDKGCRLDQHLCNEIAPKLQ